MLAKHEPKNKHMVPVHFLATNASSIGQHLQYVEIKIFRALMLLFTVPRVYGCAREDGDSCGAVVDRTTCTAVRDTCSLIQ